MKNIITIVFTLLSVISLNGQIIELVNLPDPVKRAFERGYPTITDVQWSINNNYYNGTYEVDQLKKIVTYDEYGIYIESKGGLLLTELPTPIQDYVNLHGTGDFLKEYYKVLKADGTEYYEVLLNDKKINFDSEGNLTKSGGTFGKI